MNRLKQKGVAVERLSDTKREKHDQADKDRQAHTDSGRMPREQES